MAVVLGIAGYIYKYESNGPGIGSYQTTGITDEEYEQFIRDFYCKPLKEQIDSKLLVSYPDSLNNDVMHTNATLYQLFDVAQDANQKTLRNAYKNRVLKWHPDKLAVQYPNMVITKDHQTIATQTMQIISTAFTILSDSTQRAAYDRALLNNFNIQPGVANQHYKKTSVVGNKPSHLGVPNSQTQLLLSITDSDD